MENHELNLATLSVILSDEDNARHFLESKRWPDGVPVCPHCCEKGAYKLNGKPTSKRPVRKGVWKCKSCRKQFTVRVGTVFEDSKIPLRKWLMAIHLMTSSKKGVSSHQIAREVGITVKSAWFLTMRIRESMRLEPLNGMLEGAVEIDESYVGGKPRPSNNQLQRVNKRGRGTKKQPIMVLVGRDGGVRCTKIDKVDRKTLHREIRKHVDDRRLACVPRNW